MPPIELELVSADAVTPRYVIAHAVPLLDADGAARGAIAALTDITGRKAAEAQIADVVFTGDAGPYSQDLERIAAELRAHSPLRPADLRLAVQRMRELPGLTVKATTRRDELRRNAHIVQVETDFKRVDGVVELSLWTGFTGPDRPAYEALVKQFNDSHPKIKVTMDVQPWDAIGQKLPGAWATGQGPDLATPNFDPGVLFTYVKTNSLLPLDEAVGDGDGKLNTSLFPKAVGSAFTIDGKLYAAPANMATLVLYYNKAMLAEAGVTEPKTADDLVAASSGMLGFALANVELCIAGQVDAETAWRVTCEYATSRFTD